MHKLYIKLHNSNWTKFWNCQLIDYIISLDYAQLRISNNYAAIKNKSKYENNLAQNWEKVENFFFSSKLIVCNENKIHQTKEIIVLIAIK